MSLIVLAVVAALIGYLVALYNGLVKKRQMVEEGWSGIDVQLKRRADLIPNLVETVKGYASHEKETLEEVTAMRARVGQVSNGNPADRAVAEGALSQALGRLLAVAEAYPELKADSNFRALHESLDMIEDALQKARRYYNGAVRMLNVAVESFPSNLVAGQFGFMKADYFEIEDASDRAVPKISF
ncbi:LemA family protein [Roseibium sp. CAU 1637]|uniref:LemA family protein n=1 Tax=Roseibium limicola TaxID=2816037 RepID=A0A939EP09_9HYPH|nr:LemA family protein [Roseibium limicola]MBO0345957.1 LemA family protein [Roseibium limicola]